MKIEKLHTMDFMGIPGKKVWEFRDKVTVLSAPNGAGKTSVISALRYALTGLEPEGEMIHKGKTSAAVQIDTAKGSYCRIKKLGKQSRYVMNGKTTSLGELTRALEEEMGVSVSNAKIITSSELLQGLDSRQFGELLLNYLPEMMDKETVISRVSNATPLMRKIMEDNLPGGDFGTKELDSFFAFLMEKRKGIKKEIMEEEAVIRLYGCDVPEGENEENLRSRLDELNRQRDEAVVYSQKVSAYLQVRDAMEKNRAAIQQIEEELEKITAVRHSGDERQAVEELMLAARKAAHAALAAKKLDRANYNTLKDAVETIRSGRADVMLVGATGSRIHGLRLIEAIKNREVTTDSAACRPFDARRDGSVAGEGAGAILIEELESALRRGAKIYAEVCGGVYRGVLKHARDVEQSAITSPKELPHDLVQTRESVREAIRLSLRRLLEKCAIDVDAIGHINANARGDATLDAAEALALRDVLGDALDAIPVTALKGALGNPGAGAGAIETVASLLALQRGTLFPTLNFGEPDPVCGISPVVDSETAAGDSFVKICANGLGQASAAYFKRWTE